MTEVTRCREQRSIRVPGESCCFAGRFTVGDPIDVVTGANLDSTIDFTVPGPFPLAWRRYYSSAFRERRRALGWGHSHAYDYLLEYSLDGLRLTEPLGQTVLFPPLEPGEQAMSLGVRIRRASKDTYEVHREPTVAFEFRFPVSGTRAFLVSARKTPYLITFEYANDGSLYRIMDSTGRAISVVSGGGLIHEIATADRRLMRYGYDEAGNMIAATDAYGNTATFRYDALNRMVARSNRLGYTFEFQYDAQSRCRQSHGEDGLFGVSLRFLSEEHATVVTKSDGGEWTYLTDDAGSVVQRIDPSGGTTSYQYDPDGKMAAELDARANKQLIVSDSLGNAIAKRNQFGQLMSLDAGLGASPHTVPATSLEWEYGRLLSRDSGAPNERLLRQIPAEVRQLLTMQAGPPGPVLDDSGVKFKDVAADGKARTWSRDRAGNAVRYRDRDGGLFQYAYTSWDLLQVVTDPVGNTTQYEYDAEARIVGVTDPAGNANRYVYDLAGRVSEVSRNGVLRERYMYDAAGNLLRKVDTQGNELLRFEVGPGNLKTKRILGSGGVHSFFYDDQGRIAKCSSGDSVTVLQYDAQGKQTADLRDGLGVEHTFKTGDLSATTYLGRFTVRWRRVGSAVIFTDPAGAEHRIYLSSGRIARREIANGTTEYVQYDAEGRCLFKTVRQQRFGSGLWVRQYAYSGEGDLLRIDDSDKGRTECVYDAAHRLIAQRGPDGVEESFVYDPAGNLTHQPGLDRVTIASGNLLTTANGWSFEYDERQRVAVKRSADRELRFRYDARDMLIGCESEAFLWLASYDALGRRTEKIVNGKKTRFYWDGDRLAAEIRPSGIVRLYVYVDAFALCPCAVIEADDLDCPPNETECFHVFSNQIGAPEMLQNSLGEQVWSGRLKPYGALESDAKHEGLPLRMPGHYADEELGLYYNRFRYYDPVLGRYLQPDPMGIAAGTNLYAYPANPLVHCDVRGECPTDDGEDPPRRQDGNDAGAWVAPPPRGKNSSTPPKYEGAGLSEYFQRRDAAEGVTIYTPQQREAFRVVAGPDGRLVYAQSGRPVDTSSNPGIYVMDTHGNVYIHENPQRGVIHHSSLGAGEPVATAGEIQVIQGIPTDIDDQSGHYGGTLPNRSPRTTTRELSEQGVDMGNVLENEQFPPD